MDLQVSTGKWLGNLNLQGSTIFFDQDTDADSSISSFESGNRFDFTLDNTVRLRVNTAGHLILNGERIYAGSLTGDDYIRQSGNTWHFYVDGVAEFVLNATSLTVPNVFNDSVAGTANVIVSSGGRLRLATSLSAYKDDIRPWKPKESVLDLSPVTYYPMGGNPTKGVPLKREGTKKLLGLTYEDVAEHFPKGTQGDRSVDWNAITTGLLAEVKTLTARVEALENERKVFDDDLKVIDDAEVA
jgi:hypothetical protein